MSDSPLLNIYPYNPSTGAAIAFTILNFFWAVWHGYLCLWYPRSQRNKHRYTIPLFIATILTTAGYAVRIISAHDTSSISLYASSASFIVIAPIFVCATLYLLLKYLIRVSLPKGPQQVLFGISPKWLGRAFITSDVFSFLTQCAGSGIASSGNWEGNTKDIGVNVLLVGLALQCATFTAYLVFTCQFVHRVRKFANAGFNPCVKKVLTGIWISSAFVQIRTIFRLIEFALGINGYPFRNEWCLYVFEAVPMFIAIGVLACCHPAKWLQQRSRSEFDIVEEKEGNKPNSNETTV